MRSGPSARRARVVVLGTLAAAGCRQEDHPLPGPVGDAYGPPIIVTSPAFDDGSPIPKTYTCDGDDVSPPLSWTAVPDGTAMLAVVLDDPDAPHKVWVHWVAWNIAADRGGLPEAVARDDASLAQGTNDSHHVGFDGPCPPKIGGAHHYRFRLFASDTELSLPPSTGRNALYDALDGHVLSMGELDGTYDR